MTTHDFGREKHESSDRRVMSVNRFKNPTACKFITYDDHGIYDAAMLVCKFTMLTMLCNF